MAVQPELNAVEIVCRHVHPRVACLPVALEMMEDCIGVAAHWTMASASASVYNSNATAMLRFLSRVAATEPTGLDPLVKHKRFSDALVTEVGRRRLRCVQWLVEEYLSSGRIRQAVKEAARCGLTRVLQWLHTHHFDRVAWGNGELNEAVHYKHFETAKWLWDHGARLCDVGWAEMASTVLASGFGVDVAMAEWLLEQYNEPPEVRLDVMGKVVKEASTCWRPKKFQGVLSPVGIAPTGDCLVAALRYGNLDVCKWLVSTAAANDVDADGIDKAMLFSADFGRWEIVKWTLERWPPGAIDRRFSSLVVMAAKQGNLAIIKYLHERWPSPRSTEGMYHAARIGRFDIVQWLDKTPMRGGRGIDGAAYCGHLEIIRWLHRERPKDACSPKAMDCAATANHLDAVRWLHANRREGCTTDAMDEAAGSGHLDVVRWLHSNRREGCTARAMDEAAANGHLDTVKWLHAHRREGYTAAAMGNAAWNGHLEVMQWLDAHRRKGCSSRAVENASLTGHADVVEWLLTVNSTLPVTRAVEYAVQYGYFDVLLAIHRARHIELPLTPGLARAVRSGHCELVQFLVREYGGRRPGLVAFLRAATRERESYTDSTYVLDCLP